MASEASKSQKQKECLEELDQRFDEQMKKRMDANKELALWKQILGLLTAPDSNRGEKPEDMRWVDYLKRVANLEELEAPSVFLCKDVSPEDAIIHTAGHITAIRNRVSKAENAANRADRLKRRKMKTIEKRENHWKRKADEALEAPEVLEQKKESNKHLNCMC